MNETFANKIRTSDTSVAEAFLQGVVGRHFIVGSLSESGVMSFSPSPIRHTTKVIAQAEAKRLAERNPGTSYIVAQLVAGYLVPRVIGCHEF